MKVKRYLSILLAIVMTFSLTVPAFATEETAAAISVANEDLTNKKVTFEFDLSDVSSDTSTIYNLEVSVDKAVSDLEFFITNFKTTVPGVNYTSANESKNLLGGIVTTIAGQNIQSLPGFSASTLVGYMNGKTTFTCGVDYSAAVTAGATMTVTIISSTDHGTTWTRGASATSVLNPVAAITSGNSTAYYATLAEAVSAAAAGDTITLLADDYSLSDGSEITINKALTITGPVAANGEPEYTIYGKNTVTGYNDIFITGSGDVTISNVRIRQFGNNAATDAGHAPVYVSSYYTGKVTLDNVYITEFNRGGLFLYGGEFEVTDCFIDCAQSRTGAYTKGIEIKDTASGTISNTVIQNMERPANASDATAAVEIYSSGNIEITGCTFISDNEDHSAGKATYGIVASPVGVHNPDGGTLTVSDTMIDATNGAISISDSQYGTISDYVFNIQDCDFTNYIGVFSDGATVNINGGSYSKDLYVDAGTVNVTDGEFTGFAPFEGNTGSIVITGGIFDADPTDFLADGYKATEDEGIYTVSAINYVAQIGVEKYETLAAALKAAKDGDTVTLLKDTTLDEAVTLAAGTITILQNGFGISNTTEIIVPFGTTVIADVVTNRFIAEAGYVIEWTDTGAAYTYTVTETSWPATVTHEGVDTNYETALDAMLAAVDGDTVTINEDTTTTLSPNSGKGSITLDLNGYTASNGVSGAGSTVLTVTGGTITKGNSSSVKAVSISGGSGEIILDDVTVTSTGYALYSNPGYNNTTGSITVNGGTYTGAAGAILVEKAGGSSRTNGGEITIYGGTFNGAIVVNAGTLTIYGGTFTVDPSEYVATGYEAVNNGDGTYTVLPTVTYVAQTGGVKYETLAAAIEAAEVGGTVTLLTDIDVTSTINITKSLTIDGNNKTINVTGGAGGYGIYIKDESTGSLTVDISDLTLNTTGYQVALLLNSDFGSEVNIENVDINCDGECIYSNGLGTVTATGCDFSHTGTYAPGKDAVYYSALIVGYGGEIIAENCTVTSFGNGAATFPSGGTITLTNTDITINEDTENETNAGYAMWSRNEDYTNYPEYCRDSVITFNSGSVYGDFKITDKYTSGAQNLYDPVIVIKGGIFSEDPSAYVATGYEAVAIDEDPYFFEVVPATPTATVGMSITLEDNIVVNFFVSELSHSPARYTVNYRFEGGTATEANLGEVVEYESGIYRFAVATATAKQMTDKVYFDVYADDTLIKTVTYSIAQYCDTQTSTSADTELVELCKATSTFGAKAQAYFNYKTGNAPVDYSEEFDASEIPSASEYAAEKSAAVTYPVSASLNLLSKTELNFYIYNTASYYEIYGVEEKLSDSDSWNNITVSQERNNDGKMKVTIPGVSPDRLDNTYRLHIASDEYVTYSPLTYVTRHANDGDALGALCQSLYFYYKTARDYTAN